MADIDPKVGINMIGMTPEPVASPPKRSIRHLVTMTIVPVLIIGGGVFYWLSQQGRVSTDNAYVQQDKVSVSAEVGGRIVSVAVRENQQVRAGDLLFRIDPEPYRIQIAQSDAAIATAQANQNVLQHAPELTGADIAGAREDMEFASANFERQRALWQRGFTTKAAYEAAEHQLSQAREMLRLAQAKSLEARAKLSTGSQVPGVYPAIAAARAQRESAILNLNRTEVRSPLSGVITQADRLLVGQQLVSGLPVVTVVANGHSYVEANFKETDLAKMRVGQPAEIRLDAYPDIVLKGHVSSLGAGTGSEFSVLPAQNATGNWVKVTQRVPVRIAIDSKSPRRLIAGLSSKVTVFTDGRQR